MTFEHLMDQRFNAGREEGLEEGLEKGREEGREEGLKEGCGIGEEKLNRLNLLLIEHKRMEDLKRATEDEAFRKQLYQEFGLEE